MSIDKYMIYDLDVVTEPSTEPVTVDELKAHLNLNDDDSDTLLEGFIKSAREFFEKYTGRAVHPTTYRQYLHYFNGKTYLRKAKVISIDSVYYYNADNDLVELEEYNSNILSVPAYISCSSYPQTSGTINPVAYVEFTAGWDEAKVPSMVKLGIVMLASMYYQNRESHNPTELKEVPMSFKNVCDQFKTGLTCDWEFIK